VATTKQLNLKEFNFELAVHCISKLKKNNIYYRIELEQVTQKKFKK